ncbi:trehalose 6-phosphate synthase [Streptosporangium becharense]|uniref:Trehalose 6-phosphate synthase n=1 Tax=Streptosporangium becharense TaxID=1816182 RepID=A0A7W9IIN1_9ACTN|nr:trehalose-6-phosphate synthase [Streptosporangium becharense]MBB2914761.1 trehalose 6-phosphate synthase [Streptosporangium becharense]MBB5820838.1 trehalose 6-phosphate synthase [Streptosporangium becharense]
MNAILVASNRGPVSFTLSDDGSLSIRRGGGGLVSGLSEAAKDLGTLWVCAALSDGDRGAARLAPGGRIDHAGYDTGALRMLDIPQATFHRAYNAVANSTLWFVNHLLYDTPNRPHFDARFRREWESYQAYNEAFAMALAEEAAHGARVMVQDYHLSLAPAMLRGERPDVRIAHFSHTPWAPPEYFSLLPDDVGVELLEGILGADHAGFLTARWGEAFMDCCEALLGARVDRAGRTVAYAGRTTRIGVHSLGVDGAALWARASEPDVESHMAALRDQVGDRRLIVRIDRTELSKNIVRGLTAYREFLAAHPEWHGRVTHLAFAYPSRHDLPEYREYTAAVQRCAQEIEDEYATEDWDPLILNVNDDYPRSLAAYRLADVLLVNPIRDGMNLVAKEGPVLSPNSVLVLSREAGAAAELGEHALTVNPYDVSATAAALHEGLTMPEDERARRGALLVAAATALPPSRWFADQLDALK